MRKRPHVSGPRVSMIVSGVICPLFQPLRHSKGFHDRAKLVIPLHRAVKSGLSAGSPSVGGAGRLLGSKSGSETRLITSPVKTSISTAVAPRAFSICMPPSSTSVTVGLHCQIQRQFQGLIHKGGVAQAIVKKQLCSCHADHFGGAHTLLAEACPPQNMRRHAAIGVKAHLARGK
jgi:hypothetical protein